MDNFAVLIGNNIRNIRFKKNITQKELAKRIGCTRSSISKIESGVRNPSIELAVSISKALGEPIDDVFIFKFVSNDINDQMLN